MSMLHTDCSDNVRMASAMVNKSSHLINTGCNFSKKLVFRKLLLILSTRNEHTHQDMYTNEDIKQ